MNLRGPRKLTESMSGWIEVFAPVFESKVNELNVIPMYWIAVAEQDQLEVREIPVDRVRRLARVGDGRVDLGVDGQGRVGVGLEETERVASAPPGASRS